jgi:hypothetical protein
MSMPGMAPAAFCAGAAFDGDGDGITIPGMPSMAPAGRCLPDAEPAGARRVAGFAAGRLFAAGFFAAGFFTGAGIFMPVMSMPDIDWAVAGTGPAKASPVASATMRRLMQHLPLDEC